MNVYKNEGTKFCMFVALILFLFFSFRCNVKTFCRNYSLTVFIDKGKLSTKQLSARPRLPQSIRYSNYFRKDFVQISNLKIFDVEVGEEKRKEKKNICEKHNTKGSFEIRIESYVS